MIFSTIISITTLKQAIRHISGGLNVPYSASHEYLEIVAEDLALLHSCEQLTEEGTAMKSYCTGM